MRVGYVLKTFPRLSETFILTELLGLQRLGADLHVESRYRPELPVPHEALGELDAPVFYLQSLLQERFWEPFEIHQRLARRFGAAHDAAFQTALSYRSRQELRYWLLASAVAERAADTGRQILHAHFATGSTSVARYASKITGIPYTFTAHAKDIYAAGVDRQRLRHVIEDAACTVTVSDANARFLRSLAPRGRLVRVYNGLDLERFPFIERNRLPADPPRILSVARLVEKKGLDDLIRAVAALRDAGRPVHCRIIGSGPLEEPLKRLAVELELDGAVEFIGAASQEEVVRRYLPEATAFVLPCVVAGDGDRDGLPTTILEAMAAGVPVVSTWLEGVDEAVVDGETGWMADPRNVDDLAERIRSCLDRPGEALRRAARARALVESRFDSSRNARELMEVFQQAARPLRPAAARTEGGSGA